MTALGQLCVRPESAGSGCRKNNLKAAIHVY
jgi:hypothetical protein